jgi:hypothetical protein
MPAKAKANRDPSEKHKTPTNNKHKPPNHERPAKPKPIAHQKPIVCGLHTLD